MLKTARGQCARSGNDLAGFLLTRNDNARSGFTLHAETTVQTPNPTIPKNSRGQRKTP